MHFEYLERVWEWEGMEINTLLREGMEMLVYSTMEMGWEWKYGHGNGIEKLIPAHLYFEVY